MESDDPGEVSELGANQLWLGEVELEIDHEGLTLETQRWRFGSESGIAFRARTRLPGAADVIPPLEVGPIDRFLPDDEGPWAAINGGFYDESSQPLGLIVSDGTEYSAFAPRGGSGVFYVDGDGPGVIHRDEWTSGAPEAMQSIDRLVDQGHSLVLSRNERRAARSAVVVGEQYLWVILVAADFSLIPAENGYSLLLSSRRGLPLWGFAQYLVDSTDAVSVLNLDGGPSVGMVVRAGGQGFEIHGERGTTNAIVLRPGDSRE